MHLARAIAEIAERQGGHITAPQLHALGVRRSGIAKRVAAGRLIRVHHGVYAVGHLPTNPIDRAAGALLAAGDRSALGFWGAAACLEVITGWPDRLELIAATDRRPAGLLVHRSITLRRRDIRIVRNLRITSPARTALDLAPRVSAERLTRLVNDLRHERNLAIRELRDVVRRNPRHPGAGRIRELIGDAQREPTRSELENAFLRMIKRYELPTPMVNVHVAGERVDAYFPDHALIVELDGGLTHAHDWRPAFEDDRRRGVDILLKTGIPTIHFTWDQITRRQRQTAAKLAAILAARAHTHAGNRPNRQQPRW